MRTCTLTFYFSGGGGGGGVKSIIVQISIFMFIFPLFSDKILGGAKVFESSNIV